MSVSTPLGGTAIDWLLGLGAVALGGAVVAAAFGGAAPSGGVNAAWTRDIFPAWRTSWIRERPEFYAELVSRCANPDLPLEARDPSGVDHLVMAPDAEYAIGLPWHATMDLCAAMEDVRRNLVEFLWTPTLPVPGQGEVPAYSIVHAAIKNGSPRDVLTDEERAALREFLEAVLAYGRIHKAAWHETEAGTEIGDAYAGALVSVDDLARVLGRYRDDVREKLTAGLTDQAAKYRRLKDTYSQQRLADIELVRTRFAQSDKIPFAYVKSYMN